MLALGLLVAGILYLDEYKENLIDAELAALATQAEMFAVALSEAPVTDMTSDQYRVSKISNQIVRRLVKPTGTRARLFNASGRMLADSRRLPGAGGSIAIQELPSFENSDSFLERSFDIFDRIAGQLFGAPRYSPYRGRVCVRKEYGRSHVYSQSRIVTHTHTNRHIHTTNRHTHSNSWVCM